MVEHCGQHGTNCEKLMNLEKQTDKYNDNQVEIVKSQSDLRERMTQVEASAKSAHHRLDSQEEQTKAIYELAYEMKAHGIRFDEMLRQMAEHKTTLKNHEEQIDTLKNAPAENILKIWKIVGGIFLTQVTGGILLIVYNWFVNGGK